MDAEVRLGEQRDVSELALLWSEMVDHHRALVGREWPVRGAAEAWSLRQQQYRRWLEDDTGILLLATRNGAPEPVGYAMCRVHVAGPTFDLGTHFGDVESLAVSLAARGSGVGTALLRACREELRTRGITYWSIGVLEANVAAVALYERLGFRPWNRQLLARIDNDPNLKSKRA